MFHPKGPSLLELAEQALSSTDRGYDLLASKFDHTPFRTPDAVLRRVMERLGATPEIAEAVLGGRVLDLCCGTGAALMHADRLRPDTLVGIDRSVGMLHQARQTLDRVLPHRKLDPRRLSLLRADALALPFENPAFAEPFELVTCFGAFGHILEHDEPRLVEQVRSALRPDGVFVFVTGDPPEKSSPAYLLGTAFNAVMRVRNALWKPEFVMYYLTFLLPRARQLLEAAGFEVTVERDVFDPPFQRLVMVAARRTSR